MKIIERIFENIFLTLGFMLLVMPQIIRKYLLEMRDCINEKADHSN